MNRAYKKEIFEGSSVDENPLYTPSSPHILINATKKVLSKDINGNFNNQITNVKLGLDEKILSRHLMLLGGIGTGKSNFFNLLVRQLRTKMTAEDVMIIFDTKGDYYKTFYLPNDIVISNDSTCTHYWNIFEEILVDGINQGITLTMQEISRILFQEKLKNTQQPFFPNAAKDLLYGVLYDFAKKARGKSELERKKICNNKELIELINKSSSKDLLTILSQYPPLKGISSYIDDNGSDQSQGVMSELHQLTREIFIGNFAQAASSSINDFSIRKTIRDKGGKVVFIEYDLSAGSILTPIYRLIFDMAFKEALGRSKNTSNKGNVYFILDEFKLLPHLHHIDDAVNFGRSLGVKVIAGLQSIEQLYNEYGESGGRAIASGFSTLVSFRVNDAASREFIKNIYGKNKYLLHQRTDITKSLSGDIKEGNVVEDWDVSKLEVGEAIVGFPFADPFKIRFEEFK